MLQLSLLTVFSTFSNYWYRLEISYLEILLKYEVLTQSVQPLKSSQLFIRADGTVQAIGNFEKLITDSKDKQKLDLGLLEEDDEFEEFPAENWTGKDEDDTDINVWEDNWDDETAEDDFSIQLSAEIQKQRQVKG